MSEFKTIQISKIKPNEQQPREYFTGIEDLAESIKVSGLKHLQNKKEEVLVR